jgi:hypothetical protein
MADRSFEEQVRDEMAGLLIRPAAAVWEKLEADLTRKKKRRGLIWFVFAGLGILLLSAIWYTMRESQVEEKATLANIVSGKNSAPPKKEAMVVQTDSTNLKTIKDKDKTEQPDIIRGKAETTAIFQKAVAAKKLEKQAVPVTADNTEKSTEETIANKWGTIVDLKMSNVDSATIINNPLASAHKEALSDSVISPDVKTILTADTASNEMTLQKEEKTSVKKRWQLSLAVTAGISGMRKLPGQTLVYQSSISNPSTGGLPGGNNTYKVPSLQDAGSYGISLQADKQLSKRYGLGISLGYETYRSKTGVGRRVDSSLQTSFFSSVADQGFYYISSDSVAYVNRFHFAQAAVSGYALYAAGKSLQLRWELGLGLSALLASNALHYDQSRGVLFTNSSLLRTLQWNLSTGVELGFGKQPFLFLGPQITWFIQSPYTDQGSVDQHLFRTAFRARIVLGKKRK